MTSRKSFIPALMLGIAYAGLFRLFNVQSFEEYLLVIITVLALVTATQELIR